MPDIDFEPNPASSPSTLASNTAKTTSADINHHLSVNFEAIGTLRRFSKQHELDPNLPIEELDAVDDAFNSGNAEKGTELERELFVENSPYPEVCPLISTSQIAVEYVSEGRSKQK